MYGKFPNYPQLVTELPPNPPKAPRQIIIRISVLQAVGITGR